jgi:hypothetical protein
LLELVKEGIRIIVGFRVKHNVHTRVILDTAASG